MMPKRRSGGPSVSGGGGGGGMMAASAGGSGDGFGGGMIAAAAPAETPLEVEPEPVVVREYSATRQTAEDVLVRFTGPAAAVVQSASGNAYRVNAEPGRYSCVCPDFIFRHHRDPNYACRHVRAALSAAGRPSPAAAAIPPAEQLPRRAEDEVAAARQSATAGVWETNAAAYAASPDRAGTDVSAQDDAAFAELWRQAQNPPEYQYADVLPNPGMTFGLEIEFDGGDRQAIARDLYEEGLVGEPRQSGYHTGRTNPSLWAFESDASVTGGEIVSPVFRDTPTAWRQIEKVCEIIRRHGGRATTHCGGHIHIGTAAPLDSRRERWNRLLQLVKSNEDLFYRMAAGGESRGHHRGNHYARPVANVQSLDNTGHYHAVNKRRETVEFRYFNGTLDPRHIQSNVRLAAGAVNAAAKDELDGRLSNRAMTYGSHARRQVINGEEEDHGAVRRFLDTVFTRAHDKAAALWLYATSRWQAAT